MKKRESGFTLIELLVVIAIIGILAAIAVPNLLNAVQRGKQKRTMSDMRALATAIEAYAVDQGLVAVRAEAAVIWLGADRPDKVAEMVGAFTPDALAAASRATTRRTRSGPAPDTARSRARSAGRRPTSTTTSSTPTARSFSGRKAPRTNPSGIAQSRRPREIGAVSFVPALRLFSGGPDRT